MDDPSCLFRWIHGMMRFLSGCIGLMWWTSSVQWPLPKIGDFTPMLLVFLAKKEREDNQQLIYTQIVYCT
jgi:hypothetical protein